MVCCLARVSALWGIRGEWECLRDLVGWMSRERTDVISNHRRNLRG